MPPTRQLWVVVEGNNDEENIARHAAAQVGVGAVLVARSKIEQSYEPRMISAK
jgi:hypothetical protein